MKVQKRKEIPRMEENNVRISGIVESNLEFNNTQFGENFYKMMVSVKRNSGIKDYIPVLISDRLINVRENYCGKFINIVGQFRSYNEHDDKRSKLVLYVFAKEYEFIDEHKEDINLIELTGYVCKDPIYRKTPLGREIADVLLAVNRQYCKSDYIPCICWGRNAKFVKDLETGAHIKLTGRIQSRNYNKNDEIKTAYEMSVNLLEVC
jgi:single-stranded DNA-binding protein